jgi:hypothetical protein
MACERLKSQGLGRAVRLRALRQRWPRLMRAETAAAYFDEKSVASFRRGVGVIYPAPINVPRKGKRWLKDAMDAAIDQLTGKRRVTDLADQL